MQINSLKTKLEKRPG